MEAIDKSLLRVLAAKSKGTVAIFDKGDYYNCYRDDARLLANEIFMSDVSLKKFSLGDEQMQYINLNQQQVQRVIKELLTILRYRVEIYIVTDGSWVCKAKGTIGNSGDFDEVCPDLANLSAEAPLMAITVKPDQGQYEVTAAWADMEHFSFTLARFTDAAVLPQLEQCIVGMGSREALVIQSGNADVDKKVSAVLARTGVLESHQKKLPDEHWDDAKAIIKTDANHPVSPTHRSLITSLARYLQMDAQSGYGGKFCVCDYKNTGYMRVDAAAVTALELFHLNQTGSSATGGTLYSLLNKCQTAGGQRMLKEWIARPLCDVRLLEERQDAIQALVECGGQRRVLMDQLLPRVPDASALARKLLLARAKLGDCHKVYQLLCVLRQLERVLKDVRDANMDSAAGTAVAELMMQPLNHSIEQFDKFVQLIRATIDEDYYLATKNYRIKPDIDPELLRISEEMDKVDRQVERAVEKMQDSLGLSGTSQVKLERNAQHGFCYRVTLKEERSVRSRRDLTVLDANKGNGLRFRDDRLKSLNDEYVGLKKVYDDAQANLEKGVIETCAGYAAALSTLSACLSVVDVCVSLAAAADDAAVPWCRPQLEDMGTCHLSLVGCRHPVLETHCDTAFIANSCDLGDKRMMVLTGANMGGKSTYLRSVALCTILAQMGSRVPAQSARLSVVDAVFARVGASDHISRGISTFMAEMVESAGILESATSNSLVIVDELGRGTSTFDGFGLAWAIASDLLERVRCRCLFATHFHEMAELANKEGVQCKQMRVSTEGGVLTLLFEVVDGVAESSFGLHVARMVHFDDRVIQEASSVLSEMESAQASEQEHIRRLKAAPDDQLIAMLKQIEC